MVLTIEKQSKIVEITMEIGNFRQNVKNKVNIKLPDFSTENYGLLKWKCVFFPIQIHQNFLHVFQNALRFDYK